MSLTIEIREIITDFAIFYSQNEVSLESAAFSKKHYNDYWKAANIASYNDQDIKRKLKFLKDIGTAALSDTDLTALNAAKNKMSTTYNNARICPFAKQNCNLTTEGLTLDPEIDLLMSSSENFDELKWTWEQWRENTGKHMKENYKEYIKLMNKAAAANGKRRFIDAIC